MKSRTGEFANRDRWREVEEELHRSPREAARNAGMPQASHLEGEAILKGLGETEEDRGQVFTFFREPAEGATLDPELEVLKKGLRHMLSEGNVQPPDWEDREAARVVG